MIIEEKHENEQYFFTEETAEFMVQTAMKFNKICCICCPSVGKRLEEKGADVTILDIDKRFSNLSGFKYWDIKQPEYLAEEFDFPIDIIIKNPTKAERIAEITSYAILTASSARKKDLAVPQDAYRHVLWSYLLTKEFGEQFAKKVTDAHEIGAHWNTEADHIMDYKNNEVGRRYAMMGYTEESILKRVMMDPEVIRSTREALLKR